MTEEQIKQAYLEWIEANTNNTFDIDNLPGGIKLALDNLVRVDPMSFNVTSEQIDGLSQSFASKGDIPKFIYVLIKPYRKLKSL